MQRARSVVEDVPAREKARSVAWRGVAEKGFGKPKDEEIEDR